MNGQARFAGNGLYESTDLIKTMAAVVQSIVEGSLFSLYAGTDGSERRENGLNLYLIRHGETSLNREKRLQGRSNEPLSDTGIGQAEKVRSFFEKQAVRFDCVFSSPLLRARQTAEIVTGCTGIMLDERLLEMDYGPYEGMSLEHPLPEVAHFFQDFVHHPAPEGMESLGKVTERMRSFLEEIKACDAQNILVATHAIALKGALEALSPSQEGAWWSVYISPCAVYHTVCSNQNYSEPLRVFSLSRAAGV